MRKKLLAVVLAVTAVICAVFTFGACDRFVGAYDIHGVNGAKASYSVFTGKKEYAVNLNEGDRIKVEIASERGTLHITIGQKGKAPVYSGNVSEDFSFTVNIDESGRYILSLEGEEHAGKYEFDWSNSEEDAA